MACRPRDHFQCGGAGSGGQCIPWSEVCDGTVNCDNRADEECDMCTNDLYTCKDLSRINCTLACSTLGYIPCQNYMDRKICASVMKRHSQSNFIEYQSILFPILGIFSVLSLLAFLIVYFTYYRRNKLLAQTFKSPMEPSRHSRARQNSSYSSIDYNYPCMICEDEAGILDTSSKSTRKKVSENLYKKAASDSKMECNHVNKKASNDLNLIDIDIKNRDVSSSSNLEDVQSIESRDYHVYGDAPPSYNKSKYFPKADISSGSEHIYTNPSSSLISLGHNKNKNNISRGKKSRLVSQLKTNTNKQTTGTNLGEIESHIYENIEEIVSKGNPNNNNRKGKFQALKNKHSHRSSNQTNDTQIDAAALSHEFINSVRQVSSPITNTAD